MSSHANESHETIDHILRIEDLCDRFENELRAGRRPTIEGFLRTEGIEPAAAAPELLRELAKLEAAHAGGK